MIFSCYDFLTVPVHNCVLRIPENIVLLSHLALTYKGSIEATEETHTLPRKRNILHEKETGKRILKINERQKQRG